MHRRSFRLLSGGYYNQDEEFDPNISYRENPYKVFKTRTRKPSHTSRRANRNASSSSMDTLFTENQSDGFLSRPLRTQSQPSMRTVPFVSHRVTPQPALTPSSSQSQKKAKAAKSEVKTTLANAVGLRRSSPMKKAYLLLFILLLPSVWFFLPSLTSFTSSTNVTKTPTQGQLKIEPVVPAPVQNQLTPELLQAMKKWLTDHIKEADALRLSSIAEFGRPVADKMVDFALVTQGASVIRTRCSETYRIPRLYVTLFGFTLLSVTESPSTVIQGNPVLSGKCWPFNGAQGTLAISLSHPIMITHVTLDHLPRYNSPSGNINSAPKDFEIYGMKNISERGTLLGTCTYDEHGEPTQTFDLPNPSDELYTAVELRVLSNWGNVKYTCLYRFRVHGKIANP